MIKAQLRLNHELPFNNLSKQFPDARISRWCNLEVDILEIEAEESEIEPMKKVLKKMLKTLSAELIRVTSYSKKTLEVIIRCKCAINNSSIAIIEASNCIPIMPVTYKGGYESCSILAFGNKEIKRALDNLSKVAEINIESRGSLVRSTVRSSMTLSVEDFFGALTEKQLHALVQSIEMGYYNFPKGRTIAEMASLLGVSPSTFEEHLRKAEAKIMQSVRPYARMVRSVTNEKENEVSLEKGLKRL